MKRINVDVRHKYWLFDRLGDVLGYGSCKMCGKSMRSFQPEEWHSVSTGASTGVYIACVACWNNATLPEKHIAAEFLLAMWAKDSIPENMSWSREKLHKAVDRDHGLDVD